MNAEAVSPDDPEGDHAGKLARYLTELRFADLPPGIVEEAKRVLLDVLASVMLGARSDIVPAYRRRAMALGVADEATLLSAPAGRVSAVAACMFNAAVSHQIELAPAVSRAVTHFDGVVPAALAVAERQHASGEELLRAVALGCEALIRFGRTMASDPARPESEDYPVAFRKGWWTPALLAPFGASAAALLLQGGSDEQLINAWGLAVNMAPAATVHTVIEGATGRGFLMGVATANGIIAADLAADGITGPKMLSRGWMSVLVDAHMPRRLSDGLGERFEFSHVLYKHHAAVGPLFAAIEASLALHAQGPIDIDEVEEIVVRGFQRTTMFHRGEPPETAEAARSHLSYCVATALLTGDRASFMESAFSPQALREPGSLRLARLVHAELDPIYDAEYPHRSAKAHVSVRFNNGNVREIEADRSAISRYHAPTRGELSEKFLAVSAHTLGGAIAAECAAMIWNLEGVRDVRELGQLLAKGLGGTP